MKRPMLIESMDTWTPEQLLAVHEFCQQMGDMIWQHNSKVLIEHVLQQELAADQDRPESPTETNLPLPFDDELPF